jgi:hypothetical protein
MTTLREAIRGRASDAIETLHAVSGLADAGRETRSGSQREPTSR